MLRVLSLFAAVSVLFALPAAEAGIGNSAEGEPSHLDRYTAAQINRALGTPVSRTSALKGAPVEIAPRIVRMGRQSQAERSPALGLASNSHGVTVFRGGEAGNSRSCMTGPATHGVRIYAGCLPRRTPALAGGD